MTAETEQLAKWAQDNEVSEGPPATYESTDSGHALQFIDRHRNVLRYVPAYKQWFVWHEHHWRPDADGQIIDVARTHSRALLAEAIAMNDARDRVTAVKEALLLGNVKFMDAMLKMGRTDRRIVVSHEDLDADPFLLGVRNGVVELRAGTFRPGRPGDLITKRAGTTHKAGADCPRWRAFLHEIMHRDEDMVRYLQKLVGYTLTGKVSEQCFPFLYGSGKNGKSVFTETLHSLLGEYGQRAPQSLLIANANGREPTNEIARLCGARLVIGSETEEGTRLAEARVKDMTSGDTITGRFLYTEAFDFRPKLKLWMFGNHKPEIRGADDGIWRRMRLIPFVVQIPEHQRDPHLTETLAAEMPGILNWALEGTRLWLAEGMKSPKAVDEACSEYREEEDTLGDFIDSELETSGSARTGTVAMYDRYKNWAETNGIRFMLSQRTLAKRLRERGLAMTKSNGDRFWLGVALT